MNSLVEFIGRIHPKNSSNEFFSIILCSPDRAHRPVKLKPSCVIPTQTSFPMFSFLLDLSNNLRFVMSSSQNAEVVNILKRRCEVLEEQLALASEPQPKR
jgi:hypothetical protein